MFEFRASENIMSYRWFRRLAGPCVVLGLALAASAGAAPAPTAHRAPVAHQPPPSIIPARIPGDDPRQLKALVERFEALQDDMMRTGQVAGAAVVVVKGGKVISQRGLGVADALTLQPVTTKTAFRLASLSKAFAATLAGKLVEQGYLHWDDHVQDLVPVFELSDTRQAPKVTVEDVLSHRVGLPHNAHDRLLEAEEQYPMLVYKLRELPMTCSVGDCYAYQNIAYSLIGDVTFATTGDFYYHQVERQLFHPLGMLTATYGRDALEASGDYARPHVRRRGRWQPVRPKETYYRVPPAAGVNASIEDMGIWLNAHLGHYPDVLSPELLEELHKPRVATPSERVSSPWRRERLFDASYALGWRVYNYGGETLVFHAGAVQGFRGMIGFLPARDFGFAMLWNSETGVPAGLLPTLLDGYLGLPTKDWMQLRTYARGRQAAAPAKVARASR